MATRRREDTLGGTATATTSGVTRPDIGAATTSGGGTRTRGLLAFLEDKVTVFAFHADGCQTQLATPVRHYVRGGRRRRRQQQPQEQSRTTCCDDDNQASRRRRQSVGQPLVKEEPSSLPSSSCIAATGITTSLTELLAMHQPKIVVLFFYDPEQAYSVLVRNRLLPVLHAFLDDKQTQADKKREDIDDDNNNEHIHERSLLCCAVTRTLPNGTISPAARAFLSATGLVATDIPSGLAWSHIFQPRVHATPHVLLVHGRTGQAIGGRHEDLALEWNEPAVVRQRWLRGQSSLDTMQQILATFLFPTSCAIL